MGESVQEAVTPGAGLRAGTINLTGSLTIRATAAPRDSFLAEMVRLMEAAEGGRSHYRRIADRAAHLYAPVVHSAALLSFLGWVLATGDWHRRSEEHTSELQSLMRISYAVFCLKKKKST